VLGEGVSGSPKYLCPEALLPSERVGPAGDVYSLSLTLYQIFSGGLYPFVLRDGATVGEVLECHTRRSPLSLRTLGLGVPDDVVDLIHEGLHKNPARRPSAAAVAHLLREEQRRQRLGLPATRRRRLLLGRPLRFWLNALAWTALTAAGAWALWRG
jgi:serine/threonine protein kinase